MGVDAFRMDTEKHVSRLTLNQFYFPSWLKTGGKNFYVFGEVCTRVSEFWNHNIPAISAPFYTWAETDSNYINALGDDQLENVNLTMQAIHLQVISQLLIMFILMVLHIILLITVRAMAQALLTSQCIGTSLLPAMHLPVLLKRIHIIMIQHGM